LLSAFFFITTLWAYRRYAIHPGAMRYAPVLILFALGLMTKPSIVTLPCVLLLLDFWPLRRFEFAHEHGPAVRSDAQTPDNSYPVLSVGHLILEKLPLFALAAASSYITIQGHQGLGMIKPGIDLSLVHRLENAVVSYGRYIGKTFWPVDLAPLYPHPGAWPRLQVIVCGLLLLLITDQIIRAAKKKPYLATGWFWFLGTLVPTIGIIQVGVQAMADRFAYVPLIGLFLIIVWGAADLAERFPRKTLVVGGAGAAALIACIAVTSVQLGYWKNSIALLDHTVRVTRDNYMAHHNLGAALIEQRNFEAATAQFNRALQIRTNEQTLYELGRVAELQHRTNDAVARYTEAAKLNSQWTLPRKRIATLLAQSGNTNAALNLYAEMLRLAPRDPEIQSDAAILLTPQNIQQAMAHYLEALKANPYYVPALNNLAWILSTHPRAELRSGPEAVKMAKRACDLTKWKYPILVATLSAASAEAGQFDDAVRYAEQALALTKTSTSNDTAALEKMLQEFKARQPHRERF
jgi:tetratricopeptide (TPR) repeat protein